MRPLSLLLLIVIALPISGVERPDKKPKVPDPAEPQTLMAARGKVLLYEPFNGAVWATTLSPYKGDFQLVDGQLKVGPQAGANHPPQASFFAPMTDVVVQIRFRLDGAKRLGVMLSSPERQANVASVMVNPNQVTISRMSGWGGTTKVVDLVSKPLNVDKERWYTLLIEWCGSECLVRVDDQLLLHAEAPELAVTKGQLALQSSGAFAWYDEVRVWTAITDPTWAKRKAEVLALAAKSH